MIKYNGNNAINDWNLGDINITKAYHNGSVCYQKMESGSTPPTPTPSYSGQYLTFVAETDNVSFAYTTATFSNKLQYSLDSGSTWNDLGNGQSTTSVNSGQKVMFKASGLAIDSGRGVGRIVPSSTASVEGNIMSLAYGDNFSGQTVVPSNFQFRSLFSGVTTITSAENMVLPATTIKKQCYSNMFHYCTNLITAPAVIGSSAMTWSGDYTWSDMFHSCTSLINPPQLPALNLGTQCYWYMFEGCTALTTAPELPAPTLNSQSYQGIFKGCSRLNYIKVLATSGFYMGEWVSGVASSGTFVKNSTATFGSCGQNTVPCNWTIQNA